MSSLFFDNQKKICFFGHIFNLNVKLALKVETICAFITSPKQKIMHPLLTIKKRMHHLEIFNFKVNTSSEPPFRSKNLNPLKNTSVTAPVTPFH